MYISPVDVLGISPEEVMSLDKKGLIRLEKQLKAQKLHSKKGPYNPQQFDALLAQLADEDQKKSVYFVEKHPHLKAFITTGEDAGPKTFELDSVLLSKTPFIAHFLAPYMEAFFMRLVKRDFSKKKYDTIINALDRKSIFTEELLLVYYQYIKAQVDIVIENIKVCSPGDITRKFPEIVYKTFVLLLNTVSLGFIRSSKLAYVNAMVDYYNITKNSYSEFDKIKRCFRNFKLLEVADLETKKHLEGLAIQIGGQPNYQTQTTKSSSSTWRTVGIIIGVIIFLFRVGRFIGSSNSSSTNYPTSNYNSQILIDTYLNDMDKMLKEDKTAFYSDLLYTSEVGLAANYYGQSMENSENPFPLNFSSIPNVTATDLFITIENKRKDKPAIVFNKNSANSGNTAVFITANNKIRFRTGSQKEELLFYLGSDFVVESNANKNIYNNGNIKALSPRNRYFKSITDKEKDFLKTVYIIDSIGANASIEILLDSVVFKNVYYKTSPQKLLSIEDWTNNKLAEEAAVEETVYEEMATEESLIEETVLEETETVIIEEVVVRSNDQFFKNLNRHKIDTLSNLLPFQLITGENPYPEQLKSRTHSDINGYLVEIDNDNKEEELIFFSRNASSGRDQSSYMRAKRGTTVRLQEKYDTLSFYIGKETFYYKAFSRIRTI